MHAYRVSASVRVLDANATGLSFCRRVTPSPLMLASVSSVGFMLVSKKTRVASSKTTSFRFVVILITGK